MKKVVMFLCMLLLASCSKLEYNLEHSKWITEIGERHFILEFTSSSNVSYYEISELNAIKGNVYKASYTLQKDSIKFINDLVVVELDWDIKRLARGGKIEGNIIELDTYFEYPKDLNITIKGDPEANIFLSRMIE